MYCWIEPQCGCSICIGPPRELSQNWSGGGLRSRPLTLDTELSPYLSCACSAYLKISKMERLVGGIFIEAAMPSPCSHSCRQFLTIIQAFAHTESEKHSP